ncbi:GIY-YIG nuclease family protein [Falsirhodobacter halotolerans]|uniref:GIY-YIG nuclease family protein n=1 Tax=Falsirhodobacter halotolerans TaxID=1146892 RepID=UPI001FD3C509|nr:GIY-YIG nuclease family protein [Falsirhodobacter halotolerans]MCJ8139944.1 GIY-YIG nuclease family protein [Falsirhodobacter halotolerans]
MARSKGFDLRARVRDRYHVALACHRCGGQTVHRLHTLMTARPACQACMEAAWTETARRANISFLGRDPDRRHYARYRLRCGHETTRQVGLIERVARGETGLRCATCLTARRAATAGIRGWTLLGPADERGPNYRRYRHECGHEQEIAVINLENARVGCAACNPGWCAAPSWIYLIRIALPDSRRWIKLGYSRYPDSRIFQALPRDRRVQIEIVTLVPTPTGHDAVREETRMHSDLRKAFPETVIPTETFAPWLTVRSEVYEAHLEPEIRSRLEALAARKKPA